MSPHYWTKGSCVNQQPHVIQVLLCQNKIFTRPPFSPYFLQKAGCILLLGFSGGGGRLNLWVHTLSKAVPLYALGMFLRGDLWSKQLHIPHWPHGPFELRDKQLRSEKNINYKDRAEAVVACQLHAVFSLDVVLLTRSFDNNYISFEVFIDHDIRFDT